MGQDNAADILQMLVDHGADVNHRDLEGNTALFKARQIPIIELLIANSADLESENAKKETPIFVAVHSEENAHVLVSTYLSHSANVNHRDAKGNTVMHYLAKSHNWKFVAGLLFKSSQFRVTLENAEGDSV